MERRTVLAKKKQFERDRIETIEDRIVRKATMTQNTDDFEIFEGASVETY